MMIANFICRSAHQAFNPHFRAEVRKMKQAMLNHARLLKNNPHTPDGDIYACLQTLQDKGYSQTHIKAILAQAKLEINQF